MEGSDDLTDFSLIGGGAYASANFLDAEDSRPSGAHMESLGGNQDAIQGIIQNTLTRHISEAIPNSSPQLGHNINWRKRLREMMIRQNETVLNFLFRPVSEHTTAGPVEQALRRYAIRQDIDTSAVKSFKQILDVTDSQKIQNEIDECVAKNGSSNLNSIKSQVSALIELYKETGDKLFECESQLKVRLEKIDKLQRRVSTVIELQTNEAMPDVVGALEGYMKISFRDMGIEPYYKNLLYLYQKHIALRECIQLFKTSTTSNEPLCPICLTDVVGMAIVPCGHTFCATCARRMTTECGVCRGKIRDRMKLYFA